MKKHHENEEWGSLPVYDTDYVDTHTHKTSVHNDFDKINKSANKSDELQESKKSMGKSTGKSSDKSFYFKIYMALGVILVFILIYNLSLSVSLAGSLDKRIAEAKEAAVPARIQLVMITDPNCSDCFDIAPVISSLKSANTNVTEERSYELSSKVAEELIQKYAIEKVPALLVSGEVDKLSIRDMEKRENILVFANPAPPYTEAGTGKVIGKVSTILLESSSCEQCGDLSRISGVLEQSGIAVSERKKIDASTEEGQELIKKLEIRKLPAFLISSDINAYPFAEKIKQSGVAEKNGYYVLESPPPYVEVQTGRVRGIVNLMLVTSIICPNCYDVRMHKQIFSQVGLAIESEETVDISSAEGIELKMKYNMEKVPTVILSGDVGVYEWLSQVWEEVGTVEEDGAYVFRNVEQLGPGIVYQDLKKGEIVGSTPAS